MADKRINALTTTSASVGDDYFAIDGATNGTRALSAFSPTFGGNATVTGTLTVNGTTASVGAGTGSIISKLNGAAGSYKLSIYQSAGVDRWYAGLAAGAESGSDGGAPYSIVALTDAGAVIDNALLITRAAGGSITTPRPVSISATTASTTTSSGALVVGNGTSGGLGVGGAASIGGPILVGTSSDVYLSRVGAGILDIRSASSPGTAARLDVTGTTSAGVGFRQSGARDWFISAESNELRVSCLTAASIFAFNSGTPVAMRDTTASTSTSSGALVVSGGVGVAGAINAGDQIKSERTSGTDTASAVLGVLTTTGAGVTNSFGIDARVIVNNSSGTTTSATGLRALSRVSNVSTVTQAVAMLAQVDNPGGGTITTAYGLYVNPITAGGTNYAIYTGGGRINFQSLPTSSAGLAAGTLWNDGGTLKVA